MAAPNLAAVSTITGKTIGVASLTTAVTTAQLTCPANKALKINTIIAANIDGTNDATVTASVYDASETAIYHLAFTVAVTADTTIILLTRDCAIYLEEGDQLRAGASAAGDISLLISYEELSN
jgi:hypothetical protein